MQNGLSPTSRGATGYSMLRQVSPESESRPTMWPSTRTVTVCEAESGAWRTSNAMRSVSGLRKKAA